MKRIKKSLLVLLLLCLTACDFINVSVITTTGGVTSIPDSTTTSITPSLGGDFTLSVLTMNDLHGSVNDSASNNLAKTLSYINEVKEDNPNTLILANGDMFQGTAISNHFRGRPIIDFMNEAGFHQLNIGNHEFDWGIDFLEDYVDGDLANGELDAPIVSANIKLKSNDSLLPFVTEYTIVNLPNIRVGVIGVIGEGLENSISASRVNDYYFDDVVDTVDALSSTLRINNQCDFIVVNGHFSNDSNLNHDLSLLKGDKKIDLVVNGHYHLNNIGSYDGNGIYSGNAIGDANRLPFIEAGSNNSSIGKVDFTFQDSKKQGFALSTKSIYEISGTDPSFASTINGYQQTIDSLYNVKLAEATTAFTRENIGIYTSNLMKKVTNADFALINTGGIRSDANINIGGTITRADIIEILPFDNVVKHSEVRGSVLKQHFSYNYSYYYSSTGFNWVSLNDNTVYKVATVDYVFDKSNFPFLTGDNATTTKYVINTLMYEDVMRSAELNSGYFDITGNISI